MPILHEETNTSLVAAGLNAVIDIELCPKGGGIVTVVGGDPLLSEASSIKDLADVLSTMLPNDGDVLTYDPGNGWQAEVPGGGAPGSKITAGTTFPTLPSTADIFLLTTTTQMYTWSGAAWEELTLNTHISDGSSNVIVTGGTF